jgi:hypothetical protein
MLNLKNVEAGVASFKILCQYIHGVTEETTKILVRKASFQAKN